MKVTIRVVRDTVVSCTLHQFHDEINILSLKVDAEEMNNVVMVQLVQRTQLVEHFLFKQTHNHAVINTTGGEKVRDKTRQDSARLDETRQDSARLDET